MQAQSDTDYSLGSYEEAAGMEVALCWVLGDTGNQIEELSHSNTGVETVVEDFPTVEEPPWAKPRY